VTPPQQHASPDVVSEPHCTASLLCPSFSQQFSLSAFTSSVIAAGAGAAAAAAAAAGDGEGGAAAATTGHDNNQLNI
jgi:hypothetical protein